jgi:uncharacterized protein (TIGR00369 family)
LIEWLLASGRGNRMELRETTSTFFEYMGFNIIERNPTEFYLEIPIGPNLLEDHGSIHPGVFSTMLDIAIGATISKKYDSFATTINLNVNYFNLSPQLTYHATATIVNKNGKYVNGEGSIYDEKQTLIAKGVGIFKIR